MELGYHFIITLQILLRWFLHPVYWLQSFKTNKLISPINDPILKLSATQLAQSIRKKEITSVTVVTAYIRRISEVNPVINAVVENRFLEALKEAQLVDDYIAQNVENEERIRENQPLLGVPLTVKESCSVKGMSYCVGSKRRVGTTATEDGEAVRKLKAAGAIPLLVSNTPELCLGWESNNLVTGKTCNPYNTNLSSGGSSGGEGALLASGASIIGLGSDVAGSIRIPAMFNGVFGHKPTPRIISLAGHCPMCPDQRVADYLVIGPMTRYAKDLQIMMKILVEDNVVKKLRLDENVDFSKIVVYSMDSAGSSKIMTKVKREIRTMMEKCVKHFEEKCQATIADFKFDMNNTCEMCATLFYNLEDIPNVLQDPINGEINDNICLELVKRFLGKKQYSLNGLFFYVLQKTRLFIPKSRSKYYQAKAENLKEDFLKKLGDNGIFLYPTFPSAAFQHNKIFTVTTGMMYTMVFNILGFPCTHVPLGINSAGLPIGIQVVAAPFQDRLCLAVAQELEKCFGGWVEP